MMLSLGSNIILMEVNDYENIDAIQYQDMVAVTDALVVDDGGT